MRAWYLAYTEVMVGKYSDRNKPVEVPLLAIAEEDAIAEAKEKLEKIIAKIDEDFEGCKKVSPTGHFVRKQVENPHLILKVPLS